MGYDTSQRSEEMAKHVSDFEGETDRAIAVLAGAYLDKLLADLIIAYTKANPDFVEQLIYRDLTTFSARIDAVYSKKLGLQLISKDEQHDLHVIRGIRNKFAHDFIGLEFDTPEISAECSKLRAARIDGDPGNARKQFIKAAVRIMIDITIITQKKLEEVSNT